VLCGLPVDDAWLQRLAHQRGLTAVDLSRCTAVTDTGVAALQRCAVWQRARLVPSRGSEGVTRIHQEVSV
jgi:hypothetical protein